jgi:hypothetical protein
VRLRLYDMIRAYAHLFVTRERASLHTAQKLPLTLAKCKVTSAAGATAAAPERSFELQADVTLETEGGRFAFAAETGEAAREIQTIVAAEAGTARLYIILVHCVAIAHDGRPHRPADWHRSSSQRPQRAGRGGGPAPSAHHAFAILIRQPAVVSVCSKSVSGLYIFSSFSRQRSDSRSLISCRE